jgi:hypothetical protein
MSHQQLDKFFDFIDKRICGQNVNQNQYTKNNILDY